ncbi:hypothetical protein [Flexilinea flocculi]|uniref:Uncharacterized protein n=1 Tax=Flexilinea flocculi TaxID=1678840 RepID=A0A0S7BTE1_9CHLR|nr:hypothetical protein [Flexilinea flocculi]GAP40753.1 hypothetical protein ATC1_13732 [Flexilinea flocculi]
MNKKTRIAFLLVFLVVLLGTVSSVSAKFELLTPSQLIGSVTYYLNQARELPALIDEALCRGDMEAYKYRMQDLATALANAAATIQLMGMDIPDGLWNVYSTIAKNPTCGIGTEATGAADLVREKWEEQARDAGLYEDKQPCPIGQIWMCRSDKAKYLYYPRRMNCGCFPVNTPGYL